jgi:predicted nucleic acid-binding protein
MRFCSIGNALARSYRQEAVAVIESFLTADPVEVVGLTPERFARALARYKTHRDKEWSLVDCISFEVMELTLRVAPVGVSACT